MATPTDDSYTAVAGVRAVRMGRGSAVDPAQPWLSQSALSLALPASKAIGALGSATVTALCTGDATAQYYVGRVFNAWFSTSLLRLYNAGGQLADVHVVFHGGGHSDSGYDGTAYFSLRSQTWAIAQAATTYAPVLPPGDATLLAWGESAALRPASSHPYQHNFAVDSNEAGGPSFHRAYAGGAWQTAVAVSASHRMPWAAKAWERVAQGATSASTVHLTIKDRTRGRAVRWPVAANRRDYYVHDYAAATPSVSALNQTNFRGSWGWSDTNYPCGVHHEGLDLYVAVQPQSASNKLMALAASNLAGDWVPLTMTGAALPALSGVGVMYRSAAGSLLMADVSSTPPTGIFEITPPASSPLTNPWTVVRHAFSGASAFGRVPSIAGQIADRFNYLAELDSLIVVPTDTAPVEIWRM